MTVRQIEKISKNELQFLLKEYVLKRDNFFYSIDGYYDKEISFTVKMIGGHIFLYIDQNLKINAIESRWLAYEEELGLTTGLFRSSFYNTFNHIDTSRFPTLENVGIRVDTDDEAWLRQTVRTVLKDYYLPFAEKVKDIHFCDSIINKDIEITDEVCKISPIDGLPFRKIFMAEEASNPLLPEIKRAMRKFVNWRYKVGLEKNYDKLIRIKPVFEKLFGNEDVG